VPTSIASDLAFCHGDEGVSIISFHPPAKIDKTVIARKIGPGARP